MYLDHYGLSEAPFRITPHSDFFFPGAKRGATLDALLYAITHDEGIVKVSGEVGSGKTMVCRVLMERLPERVVVIYLANPSLSREDILYAIAEELGIGAAAMRTSAVLRSLQEHLIKLHGEGRQAVVLIDEAHAMPIETLEEIRLLSNLESDRHNLLQLVLFGQPELNQILARPEMRQLKERITHNFTLEPLALPDIATYLAFRMRAAGYRGPDIFSGSAIKLIAGASQGLTRRINILADKSLQAAFAENTHQITRGHVRSVIRSSAFGPDRQSRARIWARLAGFTLAAIFLVGALSAIWPKPHSQTAAPPAPALAAPVPLPAAKPSSAAPPPAIIHAPPPAAGPSSVANAAPLPTATPPAPLALQGKLAKLGSQTRSRIEATRLWLAGVPDQHWFIQLLGADASSADEIENFVGDTIRATGADQVHVYVADVHGNQRVGVIYGDYPSREAALAALEHLPESLRALKPFPRMVKWLR
ncbi:MAG TPA: AAA family ATPase [Rhodocyclaceae bacterium]|nr:AAA family ATPase [Rhodocyclaceae bacterium]